MISLRLVALRQMRVRDVELLTELHQPSDHAAPWLSRKRWSVNGIQLAIMWLGVLGGEFFLLTGMFSDDHGHPLMGFTAVGLFTVALLVSADGRNQVHWSSFLQLAVDTTTLLKLAMARALKVVFALFLTLVVTGLVGALISAGIERSPNPELGRTIATYALFGLLIIVWLASNRKTA